MPTPSHKNPSKHVAIADDLRRRIRNGYYEPGQALPSEADLALEYNTGRGTVRDALNILLNEKIISKSQGRLTRVQPLRKKRKKILIPVDSTRPWRIETRSATSAEHKKFQIKEGVKMLTLQRPGEPEQAWPDDTYEFESATQENPG